MDNKLAGSDLTKAMLRHGDKPIWCAVDDESDEHALADQVDNDFTARIVSFKEGKFFCSSGATWLFAVPIKIVPLTQEETGLADETNDYKLQPNRSGTAAS